MTFRKWAKDPDSTKLWFGFIKKGVLITKEGEPDVYQLRTGFVWHNDDAEAASELMDEPEMELPLPKLEEEPSQAQEEKENA